MIYHHHLLKIVFVVFMIIWAQPAEGQYLQTDEVLTAGKPVTLELPQADTLLVTYRPGTSISETQRIPIRKKSYSWTPRQAGIVALSTPSGATQNVSVRFDHFPIYGLIILIGAGTILFGGALFSSFRLFS